MCIRDRKYTLGAAFDDAEDLTLQEDEPLQHLSLRVTLTSSDGGLSSPTVYSYQVKAVPLPRIQRVIQVPVLLSDFEQDFSSVRYGFEGAAIARLHALEEVEGSQQVVTFEDFTAGESHVVQIRNVKFIRRKPPVVGDRGFGGVVILELLKL